MTFIGFSWQQLGAFVANVGNLSDDKIRQFAQVGGRWIAVLGYNDVAAGDNLAQLPALRQKLAPYGVRLGLWANYYGGDPALYAQDTKDIVSAHSPMAFVIGDAENSYQDNTKMSYLTSELRKQFPLGTKALAISTNSPNDSVVYNGRLTGYSDPYVESFRKQNIHLLPQWYLSPLYWGPWHLADATMSWVKDHGMQDNWEDDSYADHRAVTMAQIHGTVEPTGVEDADLPGALDLMVKAKSVGYGKGLSIYLLERTPASDFTAIGAQRGILYNG